MPNKNEFRKCVPPCPRFITGGDTHSQCVRCLGLEHAQAALHGACDHCRAFPLRIINSRLAVFKKDSQTPSSAAASVSSHVELADSNVAAGPSLPLSVSANVSDHMVQSAREESEMLEMSSSEEQEVLGVNLEETLPPISPAYEELLEVITRAVEKLDLQWAEEQQEEQNKSKLDERFLQNRSSSRLRQLPFFPDLHRELSKSWGKPYSSRLHVQNNISAAIVGANENGYGTMPKVEDSLTASLAPNVASSLKSAALPNKPSRSTSNLVGKAYMAAGRAGSCLHTMAVLQAYQADLLKELDEGEGVGPEQIKELRRATDLSLRATKETANAIGRSMAALVAAERDLWLNVSGIKEKDKSLLLDAPLSPAGLFGGAVGGVIQRLQEARPQQCTSTSSLHRQLQKESVASRMPPKRPWNKQHFSLKPDRSDLNAFGVSEIPL